MAKNRKVKQFCGYCGDPVVTGGKEYDGKWFHNPCYVAHTYGMPKDKNRSNNPRHSAPTRQEVFDRSEREMNPIESSLPESKMEILAHSQNVTFAMDPPKKGVPQQYYIWHGPRASAINIVRFPTYNQANQYYRDVIDGKAGVKNPTRGGVKWKTIIIVVGVVGAVALIYWLYKRGTLGKIKKAIPAFNPPTSQGTGVNATDGFGGVN
jgi:hypothetical protein